ncbi:hypothetical protein, partial [Ruminococcus sp.]|uniref:hypothetical protein n=1 Tax=Ruminococcus sp. TaxID=41978 RepID=UPI001B053AFE
MSRAIRRPHMVSAARKIFARSFLCELPALWVGKFAVLIRLVGGRFAVLFLFALHFGFVLR